MWTEGRVRIVDIAEELGVSTATVSNVIHGKTKKVSARTVKRVQEKLEEQGYYFRIERQEVILPCFSVAAVNGGEKNGSNQNVLFPNF